MIFPDAFSVCYGLKLLGNKLFTKWGLEYY